MAADRVHEIYEHLRFMLRRVTTLHTPGKSITTRKKHLAYICDKIFPVNAPIGTPCIHQSAKLTKDIEY